MRYFDELITVNEEETRELFYKSFAWLFIGMLISGVTAYGASLVGGVLISWPAFIIFALAELIMVWRIPSALGEMSETSARVFFIIFSIIDGLTLSTIFLMYELTSIFSIFLVAAGIFGAMALYGYYTERDLDKISTYLVFGLLGCLIVSLINAFLGNSIIDILISIAVIILVMGCTAWDVQLMKTGKFKFLLRENAYIYFALSLYLDFINIFLRLLSLFGKKK